MACTQLSCCVPLPPWGLLQRGREIFPATSFYYLVLVRHPLQIFSLQQVRTHCPFAPPLTQGLGFSLHAAGSVPHVYVWGGSASPRSCQVLSFPPPCTSLRLKCISLHVLLRPSGVPLHSVSNFIKWMLNKWWLSWKHWGNVLLTELPPTSRDLTFCWKAGPSSLQHFLVADLPNVALHLWPHTIFIGKTFQLLIVRCHLRPAIFLELAQ